MPGHSLALAAILAGLAAGAAPAPALAQINAPAGSYRDTCFNAMLVTGAPIAPTLAATCRRADGGTRDSILPDVASCVGDIADHDGRLYCDRRSHGSNGSAGSSASSAAAAGAVVGALIGLAIAAGASSNGNSGGNSRVSSNNTVSTPPPVTTRTQGGYHTSGAGSCGVGVPNYLAFRLGGDPNNLWPIIVDKGTRVDILVPQGTTEASHCGSPPGPADEWVYPSVH